MLLLWVCVCVCVRAKSSFVKMFGNDMFPHDSVAFSTTANHRSGFGMSCHDAARHQAATKVCRLIAAPYCHFVKSHYPNENESGKAVTEHGFRWAMCQRQSDFTSLLFLFTQKLWQGLGKGTRTLVFGILVHVMCFMLYTHLCFSIWGCCKFFV